MIESVWWVLVAAAGGLGAVCRVLLDGRVMRRLVSRSVRTLPWGTLLVNCLGSVCAGLVAGLVAGAAADPGPWVSVVSVGFLGGFTTFSTASVQVLDLLRDRRAAAAVVGVGQLVTTGGLALGAWLAGNALATLIW